MARTWLSIRVELLGGGGAVLWPRPGRLLAVGPSHTFADLARAIDLAFARWDRAHLCEFTLADGTVVTDEESGDELIGSPFGPVASPPLVLEEARLVRHVGPGDEFRYVFDLGDGWTHCCRVEDRKLDPAEVGDGAERLPVAYFGWGSVPDQYGRRWEDDDGEASLPRRPRAGHPMLEAGWPDSGPGEPVDLRALRAAIARHDLEGMLSGIEGREVDDVLQHVGVALQLVLDLDVRRGSPLAAGLLNRLDLRQAVGDDILAEDVLSQLRGVPLVARHLPVDLAELADALDGDPTEPPGYLDLRTGEVVPGVVTDPDMVGEDAYVDVSVEPDKWLSLDRPESRAAWEDMAAFAARQDPTTRARLETAAQGRGAFRRFRDVVDEEGLLDQWRSYSDDRQLGRARAYLARHGIRVRRPPRTG